MLNKNSLSIAALCSKEESRFTLNGILVTPKHTVVTDGHQLTMVSQQRSCTVEEYPELPGLGKPTMNFKPFLIPREMAVEVERALSEKKPVLDVLRHAVIFLDEEQKPIIAVHDGSSTRTWKPRMTGNFPDYERIVPKREDAEYQIFLGVDLLKRVLTEAHEFGGDVSKKRRALAAIFSFADPDGPARLDAQLDGQEFTSIVMPMRDGGELDQREKYTLRKKITGFAEEFFNNVDSHKNDGENGVPPDEWILTHGAALYGEMKYLYEKQKPKLAEVVEMPRREDRSGELEGPEIDSAAAGVTTLEDQDTATEVIGPIVREAVAEENEFRMVGDVVYNGLGEKIAKVEGERIGIAKSFAGDRDALRSFIKAELAKRPAPLVKVAPVTILPDRPENWTSLSPAEKAWVTRRAGGGPVTKRKESLNDKIASVGDMLAQLLARTEAAAAQQESHNA